MSLRASTRLVRTLRVVPRATPRHVVFARRAASSGGSHGTGGPESVWMMGSVLGWGSLTAYILMKFNGKSAHPHDLETKDVHGEYSRHAAEGEYGVDTKKAESDGEGDNAEEKEDEGKGDDEKKDDDSEKSDEGSSDDVSDEDVKKSLAQAEKANVPRVAMNEEAKSK